VTEVKGTRAIIAKLMEFKFYVGAGAGGFVLLCLLIIIWAKRRRKSPFETF
jgi:hypothetical protein